MQINSVTEWNHIIKLAVQNNGLALQYVDSLNKAIQLENFMKNLKSFNEAQVNKTVETFNEDIPINLMTDEIIKLAVQNNGSALQYVQSIKET